MLRILRLPFVLLGCVALAHAAEPASQAQPSLAERVRPFEPLAPEAALRSFRTEPGVELQLVAAEPEVTDPIALAFDEQGRLFVAEMRDYPFNPPGTPTGRIRLLEDEDNDGRFEKSTIYADGLHWPSGIACYKGGIFVSAPPDIYHLKDTDGDGVADRRQLIFTGFGTATAEDILNNLSWGLDHKVYGVTSYNGGTVTSPPYPQRPALPLRGVDFRFDPQTLELEPQSGNGDFGATFDEFGHRFVCNAGAPAIFPVIPLEYLARNRFLGGVELSHDISNLGPGKPVYPISTPEPWRVVRQALWHRWVDTTQDMNAPRFGGTELIPHGHVTGSAGITIYRGTMLPIAFRGCAFTGEPANNLVLRMKLRQDGPSYVAERPGQRPTESSPPRQEFIASTDTWFRPVNAANGPDGCLYVVDMYRAVIEDPSAIPDDILRHLDMLSGSERGRIYRVVPPGFQPKPPPRLKDIKTADLVRHLQHPDGWWQDTAHRLLFERQDRTAVPRLRKLRDESPRPEVRLRALWSLAGLKGLEAEDVLAALTDEHEALRENGLRLSEEFLASSDAVRGAALMAAQDLNARVRFQAALTLGELDTPESDAALVSLARRDGANHWMRTALLSVPPARAGRLFEPLAGDAAFAAGDEGRRLLREWARIIGSEQQVDAITLVLHMALVGELAADDTARTVVLLGLADGLARSGGSIHDAAAREPGLADALDRLHEQAAMTAADDAAPIERRSDAIGLLARARFDLASRALVPLLDARQPAAVQIAAVRALNAQSDPGVGRALVGAWRIYSPSIRREVVEAVLSRPERVAALLDALESGDIRPVELDPQRRDQLLHHADAAVRERAGASPAGQAANRDEVIAGYRKSLELTGDARRGLAVYEKNCASCHRAGDRGKAVGPDFNTVLGKPADWLLESILDPNRQVSPNYLNYLVVTSDSRTLTGIIVNESTDSVTLRRNEGEQDTIPRDQIDALRSTTLSIMPEGVEADITVEQMADLLAFIRGFHDLNAPAP